MVKTQWPRPGDEVMVQANYTTAFSTFILTMTRPRLELEREQRCRPRCPLLALLLYNAAASQPRCFSQRRGSVLLGHRTVQIELL